MGDGGTDITYYGIQLCGGGKGIVKGYNDISGPCQGPDVQEGQIVPAAVEQPASVKIKDTGPGLCVLI